MLGMRTDMAHNTKNEAKTAAYYLSRDLDYQIPSLSGHNTKNKAKTAAYSLSRDLDYQIPSLIGH